MVALHLWVPIVGYVYVFHVVHNPSVAHYDSREWDWLRGALQTVDRDYGILNTIFHDEPNAHVVHHLFSTIPHYHIVEATQAVKPVLGEYYNYDNTPILKAIVRETKECLFIEEDPEKKGVYWFSHKPRRKIWIMLITSLRGSLLWNR
ncbi:hypothetical protein L1987_61542 [Smallanthus sonchifolius]|uniref:Uncharacterized protein n=1 Tax=Smallanthus sonchifolius TaxID=185202 RepID=A0ACB9C7X7_9ASTR|nr:hypothetical protein L1987_61542 [Smallanthus sonchifolius]